MPTELNIPMTITGTQVDSVRGILFVWPNATDRSLR